MKKGLMLILAVMLFAGMAFANGGQDSEMAAYDPAMTYNLQIGCFGDFESILTAIMATDEWKAQFPNVNLEMIVSDYGGHHNRLVTAIAAGDGAFDLEYIDVGYIAQFVASGGLVDLEAGFGASSIIGDIIPFAVSNATSEDGEIPAIPVDVAPAVLFYNKPLLEASGVTEAEITSMRTWDDFFAIAEKCTKDTDGDGVVDQFFIPHPNDVADVPLNGGKGGWFGPDGKPFTPETKFKAVLDLVDTIRSNGYDANYGQWSGEWTGGMSAETYVVMPSGAWMLGHLMNWMATDKAGDIRVTTMPSEVPPASNGGSYISIPNSTPEENRAVCWEIIKFLTTNEVAQKTALSASGAFPALTTVYDDPIMDEPVEYLGGQEARRIFADAVSIIPENEVTEYDAALLSVWRTAVSNVIAGEQTVDEAYTEAATNAMAVIQ